MTMGMTRFALIAAIFIAGGEARASLFDITFSDGGANVGNGELVATETAPGVYDVVAGTFEVTSGSLQGNYSLLPNLFAPGIAYSASGYFYYDNQAFYPATPYLDLAGLLFAGNGLELNLFGYPPASDPYTMYANNGFNVNGDVTLTPVAEIPAAGGEISAVPEPMTAVSGALLLLPFGASASRILRARRAVEAKPV